MDAGETRQGMGRQGQMEISLQQLTQRIGNVLRKKKTYILLIWIPDDHLCKTKLPFRILKMYKKQV
jgi:hypothetical protein